MFKIDTAYAVRIKVDWSRYALSLKVDWNSPYLLQFRQMIVGDNSELKEFIK